MMEGMTRVKIAITIPEELLAEVKAAVAHGEATSVSAYISEAVARRHAKRPLELYVDMLKAEHGEPSPEAYEWADEQLRRVGWELAKANKQKGSRSTRAL
jgi:Arc/MetJ-type ribon-helix-helix transcriptional regulator